MKSIATLQYITQGETPEENLSALKRACEAGCDWVQLRIKNIDAKALLSIAKNAKDICRQHHSKLIINDFPEVTKAIKADGVHLGLQDMQTDEARSFLGDDFIIGGTANTLSDVLMHIKNGVDYIGLGPYRFTSTKKKLSPVLGIRGYHDIMNTLSSQLIDTPIVAIGGIELSDIQDIMKTAVHGIAVSGLITHAADQAKTIKSIQNLLLNNFFEG